jgi:hypothetical protein
MPTPALRRCASALNRELLEEEGGEKLTAQVLLRLLTVGDAELRAHWKRRLQAKLRSVVR